MAVVHVLHFKTRIILKFANSHKRLDSKQRSIIPNLQAYPKVSELICFFFRHFDFVLIFVYGDVFRDYVQSFCGTVQRILHDHLNLSKVAAVWVPKTLKPVEKEIRVQHSKEILQLFEEGEDDFLARIVTGDEVCLAPPL